MRIAGPIVPGLLALLAAGVAAQPRTLLVPSRYATIQAAIQAAQPSDTVLVSPGTYNETIDYLGKAITVRGRDGAVVTTIDARGQGSVVRIGSSSGTPVLEGFTITGGSGTLINTDGYGGGVYATGSAIIRRNIIRNNYTRAVPQPGARGHGGGIYCAGGAPTIIGNTILQNSCAGGWGGGILCVGSAPGALIASNVVSKNGGANGGGIYCTGLVVVARNEISENRVSGGRYTPMARGAGISASGAVTIRENTITGNLAMSGAGASGEGGGIGLKDMTGTVTGNRISGNEAGLGGGLFTSGGSPTITANTIIQNTARWAVSSTPGGGGVWAVGAAAITSNLIARNAALGYGGGVAGHPGGAFVNNTLFGNSASRAGGGFYTWATTAPALTNSIFWKNTAPTDPQIGGASRPVVTYSNVEGGWSGTGNLAQDPGFVDPSADDFHLPQGSPCLGAGDPSAPGLPLTDFEGDPRVVMGAVDMGADAFHPHVYATGNPTPGGTVQVKIIGYPGSLAIWALSLNPTLHDPPIPIPGVGSFYLKDPWYPFPAGTLPASGLTVLPFTFPPTFPVPQTFPMQALLARGTTVWLTNAHVVEVK